MPTARPSMVIMLITKKGRSKACPTNAVAPRARTIAPIATAMGRTAAATAPKTIASTTSATEIPMPSPFARSFSATSVISASSVASPVTRIRKEPSSPAASTTCWT